MSVGLGRGGAASLQRGGGSVGTAPRAGGLGRAPALVLGDVPSEALTGLHTQLRNMHQLP